MKVNIVFCVYLASHGSLRILASLESVPQVPSRSTGYDWECMAWVGVLCVQARQVSPFDVQLIPWLSEHKQRSKWTIPWPTRWGRMDCGREIWIRDFWGTSGVIGSCIWGRKAGRQADRYCSLKVAKMNVEIGLGRMRATRPAEYQQANPPKDIHEPFMVGLLGKGNLKQRLGAPGSNLYEELERKALEIQCGVRADIHEAERSNTWEQTCTSRILSSINSLVWTQQTHSSNSKTK